MRILKPLAILAILLATTAGTARLVEVLQEPEHTFPPRIAQDRARDQFKWIAAGELVDEFGFLDTSVLPPEIKHRHSELEALFHEALAAFNKGSEPPPCLPLTYSSGELPADYPGFPRTAEGIVANAAAVVSAIVVAAEGGFAQGLAGMMLEVQVSEWLLQTPSYAPRETVFVFYPAGDFSIGPARICAATHGLPPAPSVGDEVLLFPYHFALDKNAEFLWFTPYGVHKTDGEVRAPRELSGVPEVAAGRWEAFDRALRQAAVRRSGR